MSRPGDSPRGSADGWSLASRAFVGGTLIAETTAQIGGSMQVRTSIAATPATVGGRPGHDESWPLPGRHLRRVETAAGPAAMILLRGIHGQIHSNDETDGARAQSQRSNVRHLRRDRGRADRKS